MRKLSEWLSELSPTVRGAGLRSCTGIYGEAVGDKVDEERDHQLPTDLRQVVQAVYDRYRETGTWPTFDEIDRLLDRARRPLDVGRCVLSIPASILPGFQRPSHDPTRKMRLTLLGISICEGSEDDIARFLAALRLMARRWRSFTPALGAAATPTVDSRQVARSLRVSKHEAGALHRLGELLRVEQWGWSGAQGPNSDGTWSFSLSRDVRRFGKVKTLKDYRAAQLQWRLETEPRTVNNTAVLEPADAAVPGTADGPSVAPHSPPYVTADTVAAIEARQETSIWDCRKLLELLRELNENVERDNGYATNALLRAVLDHVPPIFGCKNFDSVVNNVSWGRTDERYMRLLSDFRLAGDDALHRQIEKAKISLLTVHDLPPRRAINRLLEECADRL